MIPDSLRVIYHYDVEITPESRSVNRQVIDEVIKKHQDKFGGCRPAFDGRKNLFCKRELPLPSGVVSSIKNTNDLFSCAFVVWLHCDASKIFTKLEKSNDFCSSLSRSVEK